MCAKNTIKNVDTLLIQLQTGQRTYQLPDDAILNRATTIKGIIATYDVDGNAKGPNGETLMDAQTFKSAYISFSDKSNNTMVQQFPLIALSTTNPYNNYPQTMLEFDLKNIVTTKCQIFLGDTNSVSSGMYLMLSIVYE